MSIIAFDVLITKLNTRFWTKIQQNIKLHANSTDNVQDCSSLSLPSSTRHASHTPSLSRTHTETSAWRSEFLSPHSLPISTSTWRRRLHLIATLPGIPPFLSPYITLCPMLVLSWFYCTFLCAMSPFLRLGKLLSV